MQSINLMIGSEYNRFQTSNIFIKVDFISPNYILSAELFLQGLNRHNFIHIWRCGYLLKIKIVEIV